MANHHVVLSPPQMDARIYCLLLQKIVVALCLLLIVAPSHAQAAQTTFEQKNSCTALAVGPALSPAQIRYSMALVFLCLACVNAKHKGSPQLWETIKKQCSVKSIAQKFAYQYCSQAFTTLCHEMGHAAMAKLLNSDPINLHLGGRQQEHHHGYYGDCGPIHLDGFDPQAGSAIYTLPHEYDIKTVEAMINKLLDSIQQQEIIRINNGSSEPYDWTCYAEEYGKIAFLNDQKKQLNRPKLAAIILAGGLCGLLSHFVVRTAEHYYEADQPYTLDRNRLKKAMGQAITPDSIYLNQWWSMLWPMIGQSGELSDGAALLTLCGGISPESLKPLSDNALLLRLFAECCLTVHQLPTRDIEDSMTGCLLGLYNCLSEHRLPLNVA